MSNEKIQQLLAALRRETAETPLDAETRSALRQLDSDIHELLHSQADNDVSPIVERARALEARFAVEHPTAEGFVREVIDTLVKIGL